MQALSSFGAESPSLNDHEAFYCVRTESQSQICNGQPVRLWRGSVCVGLLSSYKVGLGGNEAGLGVGRIDFTNNDVFEGDLTNYTPKCGKLSFASNSAGLLEYQGNFVCGRCVGVGMLTFRDGKVYGGTFEHNSMTGIGHMQYPDGSVYSGHFRNGLRHGQGRFGSPSTGERYSGQWIDDKRHGFGVVSRKDYVFAGNFCEDQYTGLGWHQDADGNYYAGHWCNHRKFGTGKMIYTDGASFDGLWVDDKPRDGVRADRASTGVLFPETYIGKLDPDGNRDGFGVVKYATAHPDALRDVFKGQFVRGVMQGHGTWNFFEGHWYCGSFKNDHFEGEGVFRNDIHGWEFQGEFSKDRPVSGVLTECTGRSFKVIYASNCDKIYQNPQPLRKHKVVYKKREHRQDMDDEGAVLTEQDMERKDLESQKNAMELIAMEQAEKDLEYKKMAGGKKKKKKKVVSQPVPLVVSKCDVCATPLATFPATEERTPSLCSADTADVFELPKAEHQKRSVSLPKVLKTVPVSFNSASFNTASFNTAVSVNSSILEQTKVPKTVPVSFNTTSLNTASFNTAAAASSSVVEQTKRPKTVPGAWKSTLMHDGMLKKAPLTWKTAVASSLSFAPVRSPRVTTPVFAHTGIVFIRHSTIDLPTKSLQVQRVDSYGGRDRVESWLGNAQFSKLCLRPSHFQVFPGEIDGFTSILCEFMLQGSGNQYDLFCMPTDGSKAIMVDCAG